MSAPGSSIAAPLASLDPAFLTPQERSVESMISPYAKRLTMPQTTRDPIVDDRNLAANSPLQRAIILLSSSVLLQVVAAQIQKHLSQGFEATVVG